MSQRLRVLQELGEEFERAVNPAPADSPAPSARRPAGLRGRIISRPMRSARLALQGLGFGGAAAMLSSIAVIVIAVGAIALLGHTRRGARSAVFAASRSELVAQYAILRRPQTAADRAGNAGPPLELNRPGRSESAQGPPGGPPGPVQVTIIPNPLHLTVVPTLTRVIARDGAKVTLFVAHATPNPAVHTKEGRALADRVKGYLLLARVAGATPRRLQRVAPFPSGLGAGGTSLQDSGEKVISVVPDNVARVRWSWPRQFNSTTLKYEPALTIHAAVRENVAIATTSRILILPPAAATWYAAAGQAIAHINNPDTSGQAGIRVLSEAAPATPLSRRAQQDPSTPNQVVVVPEAGRVSTDFNVYFRALLNGGAYGMSLTGGPHPGCATNYAGDVNAAPPSSPFLRGQTVQDVLNGNYAVKCPGTYRVSVSVLGPHHRPYPPFGSATFTVR